MKFRKFNDWLADNMSLALSSMTAFWLITVLVLCPLLWSQPTSIVAWISYCSSVIFQGIALPVLGYTARKSGDKSDNIMKEILAMSIKIEQLVEKSEKKVEEIEYEMEGLIDEQIEES